MLQVEKISTPEDLVDRLNRFENNYVFRGHSNSTWTLQTSLERLLGNEYKEKVIGFEKYALEEFKSKFELYNKNDYKPETKLEWLAMMQHYGTPTRLLDFSESPFIALYFCLENSNKFQKEDLAIYCLDYRNIMKSTIEKLKEIDSDFIYEYNDIENIKDIVFEKTIERLKIPTLWITEPKRVNYRIEKQRGTFLYTNDSQKSYEEILNLDVYKNIPCYKLEFPAAYWDNYYTILNKINITGKSIYGDLEGLSRFIKMFIQAYKTPVDSL